MKNKPLCFFHSGDFDGICSAAIVRKFYENIVELYPINYGDELPNLNSLKDRDIIICDFSFDVDFFEKIVNIAKSVVWNDHHKTAIDVITKSKFYSKISGLQTSDYSGCELTWMYLFKDKLMPEAVKLIGLYDTFRFTTDEKEKCLNFQYGLKVIGLDKYFNDVYKNNIWNELLKDTDENIYFQFIQRELIDSILKNGGIVNKYYNEYLDKEINYRCGRTIRINVNEKTYNAYLINAPMIFSDTFKCGYDEKIHDVCITYYQRSDRKWQYSVYVQKDKDIDGSIISKHFSGGGHVRASGFISDKLIKEFQ